MGRNARKIEKCRVCASESFSTIMDFGDLALTGVFLPIGVEAVKAPLKLIQCNSCFLVQLEHSYDLDSLYTDSYGYESHLNRSMVEHLTSKAQILESKHLHGVKEPVVVDIASNDGTMLSGYKLPEGTLVGIDPLIDVVGDYYPAGVVKIKEFFSAKSYFENFDKKADLVTSNSVFYDLNDPIQFAKDVSAILKDTGTWHLEQSYLPTMVESMSYDTICHEHLLYLTLHDLSRILSEAQFTIVEASLNSTNGGSIAITAKKHSRETKPDPFVSFLLAKEIEDGYQSSSRINEFARASAHHRQSLRQLIEAYRSSGYKIVGLGASTKGNVLLQWLDLDKSFIQSIGDVNPKKFGKQTPGTEIPILSENELLDEADRHTIAIVLPWHFRAGILENSKPMLEKGGRLLFPLPRIEIVA